MSVVAAEAAPRGTGFVVPLWILKTIALWIAANVGCVAAGMAIHVDLPPPLVDGPLTSAQALLVVNGLIAFSLALVASTARIRGVKLGLLLFFAYFAIASAMMQIETLWFNESLKLPLPVIGQLVGMSAIQAAVIALAGALLFHPQAQDAAPVPAGLTRRIAVMALVYVVLYYGAGALIAWQSAAVRAYYENGIHIPFVPTVLFQIVRGTLWAIIALVIVSRLTGSLARRAVVMGVMFSVLTAAQLLYPTSFFPWPVRAAHLMEVGSSEFVYGIVVTLVLLAGAAKHPLQNSIWRRLAGQA
jgi:hypothetical protein